MDKTREILDFDPFDTAERLTGKSYKTDELTMAVGMFTHLSHNISRKEYLKSINDSYWNMPLNEYIDLIKNYGFQEVYKEEFYSNSSKETEALYLFFYNGIFLKFDTYSGQKSINGGQFYYNIKPFDITEFISNRCISSGYFKDDIWVGYHDCREGIIYNINNLKKHGEFLNPWKYSPSLYWISHHNDDRDEKEFYKRKEIYQKVTKERFEKLPQFVKDCIIIDY